MDVTFDGDGLGKVKSLDVLHELLGDRADLVVWTAVDGEEVDFAALNDSVFSKNSSLDLCSFQGWLDRSAKTVNEIMAGIEETVKSIIVVAEDFALLDAIDAQLKPPVGILQDLLEVNEHFDPPVQQVLQTVAEVLNGGRVAVEQALKRKDFVDLADSLRQEWYLALSTFLVFLDPEEPLRQPAIEEPLTTEPAELLFEANMAAIEERFPSIVNDVRSAWENRDESRYQVVETTTGHRVPFINGYYQWSRIRPRADTDLLADEHRADQRVTGWDLALTWGVPTDLAVSRLDSERKDRPIMLPRHDLAALTCELHCVDIREALAMENVILNTTLSEMRWGMRRLLIMDDRLRRLTSPTMLQLDPVLGAELHEESFHTHLSRSMESFTGYSRSREWTEKALLNIPTLLDQPDIHLMKNRYKGMPGVMVSPGPSLRKNIHLLPEFAKKGVICCVSHVLRRLNELGVDPDMTVAIEANDLAPHWVDTRVEETSIMVSENSAPGTIAQPARQFWVMHDGTVGKWLRDENPSAPNMIASSCTQVALWALMEMGCDPIVMVGLDLSLENGKQYTDGCKGWTRTQGEIEVDGYYGEKVQTIATYNVFRDQYNLIFQTPAFMERRCINSTEGGVLIHGVEQLSLQEVLDEIAHLPDREEPPSGLAVTEEQFKPTGWDAVAEKITSGIDRLQQAEISAFEAGRAAKSAAEALRAGNTRKMQSKVRTAARIAKLANDVLKEDKVLEAGWLGPQHELSMRREREAQYLEDGSEAQTRHNLAHYLQFLAALHYGSKELKEHYETLLAKVEEKANVQG